MNERSGSFGWKVRGSHGGHGGRRGIRTSDGSSLAKRRSFMRLGLAAKPPGDTSKESARNERADAEPEGEASVAGDIRKGTPRATSGTDRLRFPCGHEAFHSIWGQRAWVKRSCEAAAI